MPTVLTRNTKLAFVSVPPNTVGKVTVLTIIAFGILTLVLHREMLRGDRAVLGLVCFIASYWTARIMVDSFYFSHEDWPQGKEFMMGHILLTSLFVALASSYWGLFVWQVWLRAKS